MVIKLLSSKSGENWGEFKVIYCDMKFFQCLKHIGPGCGKPGPGPG